MSLYNEVLFFICSLGVFNGLLVSIYFLLIDKTKRVPNFLFGLLTFFLTVRIGKSVYTIFTPREERNLWVVQIGLSACFLIGISLYYYLKSSVTKTKKIPLNWKIHFLILFPVIFIVGVIKPHAIDTLFWNTYLFIWLGCLCCIVRFYSKRYFQKAILKKRNLDDIRSLVGCCLYE
ncbi:hypothetical protein D6200_06090 [Tenacibaculum mesophilum]|uniref:Uncharacterized protein n=1 Tax=Tenacibaculum mesophilum TaxID=104268 RepID=A0ABN5T4G6_9FLAO|nr:hypothetical protein D6200_06090 [Tenacibaculum mesophilum]